MAAIIEVSGLTKRYGTARGIEDVTFTVEEGTVFGFLGPNGAGKTTTMRTLLGLLRPTAGTARIAGLDCWSQSHDVKRVLGYLPGEYAFDANLTGAQILLYLGNLRGGVDAAYVKTLAERLGLDLSRRFREYSRGNKQKVGLIQALMHRPRLLILDEPTGGLDPLNQQEFYALVAEVRAEGRTIFLSSHILPEIEHTCERVGIIRDGRLVTVDAVARLKSLKHAVVDLSFPQPVADDLFAHLPEVSAVERLRDGQELRLTVRGEDLSGILRVAAEQHASNLVTREPSLEEIFLRFYESGQPGRTPASVQA